MKETEHLIGFRSEGSTIHSIRSTKTGFRVINGLEPEKQLHEMIIVPCFLRPGFTIDIASPYFDRIDHPDIRATLKSGYFITTEPEEMTKENNLALLMSYGRGHLYAGRGGILIYREDGEWKPVTLTIPTPYGERKYLLDIKGTGTPEGILRRDDKGRFIGGIETADIEFNSLMAAAKEHPLRNQGVIPVSVYHGHDTRGYGQVARAIPTTLRPSFRHNTGFEQVRSLKPEEITAGMGLELGRYLGFNPPRLASNLQTDNAYLVDAPGGQLVIATDFAEIIPMHEETQPVLGLKIAIKIICDSNAEDLQVFPRLVTNIIRGIKTLRPELPIYEQDAVNIHTQDECVEYLFQRYLGSEILKQRKSTRTVINSDYLLAYMHEIAVEFCRKYPGLSIPLELGSYLEEEEYIFQAANTAENGMDKEIKLALAYIMEARRKIHIAKEEFKIWDYNVHQLWSLLPIPFYAQS